MAESNNSLRESVSWRPGGRDLCLQARYLQVWPEERSESGMVLVLGLSWTFAEPSASVQHIASQPPPFHLPLDLALDSSEGLACKARKIILRLLGAWDSHETHSISVLSCTNNGPGHLNSLASSFSSHKMLS